jgi:anti-anti-sigma regulatory factor
MLRIQRSANGQVVFKLIGRMDAEHLFCVKTLFETETTDRRIVLDLRDLNLIDRDGVIFLVNCEANDIKLTNCPAYIREWIERERGGA